MIFDTYTVYYDRTRPRIAKVLFSKKHEDDTFSYRIEYEKNGRWTMKETVAEKLVHVPKVPSPRNQIVKNSYVVYHDRERPRIAKVLSVPKPSEKWPLFLIELEKNREGRVVTKETVANKISLVPTVPPPRAANARAANARNGRNTAVNAHLARLNSQYKELYAQLVWLTKEVEKISKRKKV